ncbi:MAG: alginate lyase family protein [Acidobacteria bacterium]|nr:alginate lyase family protein [Acidobacteriota bacterium]
MRTIALLAAALPLAAQPRLLLDTGDFERIRKLAASESWAAGVRDGILRRADAWPADHVRQFGLREWALPPEGAGWSHAYVCPEHGMRLRQEAGKNLCPVDGKDYHGWPIDNVVYMQRNGDTAHAARDLGLAWQLTRKPVYAEKARRIFSAYADLYPTLPVHDNNNRRDTRSGARIMSQTLSESSWLIPLVFAYDLARDALTAEERARFETRVLRDAAQVID